MYKYKMKPMMRRCRVFLFINVLISPASLIMIVSCQVTITKMH